MRALLFSTATLSLTLLLAACSTPRLADQDELFALTSEKVTELGSDSERALDEANEAYRRAQDDNLTFYAPLHMKRLEETLREARQQELSGNSEQAIAAAAQVMSLLENGRRTKAAALDALPELFAQKEVLDNIKSANVLPEDYRDAMGDLSKLITLIESGNASRAAEKAPSLLEDLTELEIDTMLAIHWQPAADTLEKAEDEKADDNAPSSFAESEQMIESARDTIRSSYRERGLCEQVGKEALRSAQHTLYIAREAKKLQKLNADKAEYAALKLESFLHEVAIGSGSGDLRHMSFKDQALAIIQNIREREQQDENSQEEALPADPEVKDTSASGSDNLAD